MKQREVSLFLKKTGLSRTTIILVIIIISLILVGIIGVMLGILINPINLSRGNSSLDNSFNISLCVPDCTSLQCGFDPLCGKSCGTCNGSEVCTNGICVSSNCIPEPYSVTCGNAICGIKTNNCGATINCPPGCSQGKICKFGICANITPLNTGTVEETWPGISGMYFGSKDLPTNISYYGDYIKFPNSVETRCLLIAVYRFPVDGYPKSHIGFNFATSIKTGDNYQVFSNAEECQSY